MRRALILLLVAALPATAEQACKPERAVLQHRSAVVTGFAFRAAGSAGVGSVSRLHGRAYQKHRHRHHPSGLPSSVGAATG